MSRTVSLLVATLLLSASAQAEPVNCQKQVISQLLKFKKKYLKALEKCVDGENLGKIAACPGSYVPGKMLNVTLKVRAKIAAACTPADLTALGFPTDCAFENTTTGIESVCKFLPVDDGGQLADCLMCWKGAELSSFAATLYASHASEICANSLDETSPLCSELDCATPLPSQHSLGDTGENDCQKAIGKAGVKHLVSIEKAYEKCGLLGNTRVTCDADLVVQAAIDKSELKLDTLIHDKCGNRDPVVDPPFCCRTGPAQACMAAMSRSDCTDNLGGDVQEGKTCGLGGTCDPVMGPNQKITWWSTCPINDTCDGTLDTLDELIACVDASAKEIASELLCIQFATGWGPCPPDAGSPSPAFIDTDR